MHLLRRLDQEVDHHTVGAVVDDAVEGNNGGFAAALGVQVLKIDDSVLDVADDVGDDNVAAVAGGAEVVVVK